MDGLTVGVGVGVLLILAFWFFSKPGDPSAVQIQTATQSGTVPLTSHASLPRSNNQEGGAVFSFEGWLDINDFTTVGYGQQRMVFSREDCPGLYIDSTSNALLVKVATYGATESILISNIPAKMWIHFAIVISQYGVDIYINGILRQHHTLNQLPKQVDAPVQIAGSGFDGQIGGLTYYSRILTASEIGLHAAAAPPASLVTAPPSGAYLDITWFTGR